MIELLLCEILFCQVAPYQWSSDNYSMKTMTTCPFQTMPLDNFPKSTKIDRLIVWSQVLLHYFSTLHFYFLLKWGYNLSSLVYIDYWNIPYIYSNDTED